MQQVDKKTQDRLMWFLVPMGVICVLITLDITFGVDLNIGEWAPEALLGCMALFILAYIVAAWRQQCWGFTGHNDICVCIRSVEYRQPILSDKQLGHSLNDIIRIG